MRIFSELKHYFHSPLGKGGKVIVYMGSSTAVQILSLVAAYLITPVLSSFLKGSMTNEIKIAALLMAGAALAKGLLSLLQNKMSNKIVFDESQRLSAKLYDYVLKEDLISHNSRTSGQILTIVRNDANAYTNMFISEINIIRDIVMAIIYISFVLYISGWAGAGCTLLIAVYIAFIYRAQNKTIRHCGKEIRRCEMISATMISGAANMYKEMRLDYRAPMLQEKYEKNCREYSRLQAKNSFARALMNTVITNFTIFVACIGILVFIKLDFSIIDFLPKAASLAVVLMRLLIMAGNVVNELYSVDYARKSYDSVIKCTEKYEELCKMEKEFEELPERQLTFNKGVSIENLSFSYPNGHIIFENLSIFIPFGKTVAIIGPSGSGKTTFLDLLLGLLEAQEGHIYYDDYDLVTSCDSKGKCRVPIQHQIGYIPQIAYMNGETVLKNVAFLQKDEDIDKERAIECLKHAQVWDDIKKFPQGLDTVIGENGSCISGGQRQRIALARAFYKGFDLLVTDEVTAALDEDTEKAVLSGIEQMRGDRSLILVTHHMSLADACEVVFKINNHSIERIK